MGQELGIGPRVGRMFPVNNLRLPLVAQISVPATTTTVFSSQTSSSQVQHLASRGTFQQNGRAERKLRHILNTVRALLFSAKVLAPFWGEADLHVVHAINCNLNLVIQNQTPYEHLFGSPPYYHHLRSFGSACFEHRSFVEFSHFRASLSTSFVLDLFPSESHIPFIVAPGPPIDFSVQLADIFYAFLRSPSNEQVEDEQVEDEPPNPELGFPAPAPPEDLAQDIPPRHSTRVRSILAHLLDYHCYTALTTLYEPHTYRKASTDPLWQIAMKEELNTLSKNHTWDLLTLLLGKSLVGCKWINKIKTRSDGSIE
ncbi:uncharacterized protein LOC136064887 [Quercus suber]|uniref:uncharacterized protein LOC136064887 n=1 Tax=Quercus suber TaxID=58331 RepID=UPI0032DF5E5E